MPAERERCRARGCVKGGRHLQRAAGPLRTSGLCVQYGSRWVEAAERDYGAG